MVLNAVARIVAALNSNRRPGEVAAGVSCALVLALVPGGNLLWIAVFALLFLVKINLSIALLSLALFTLAAPLADPALDAVGYSVLTAEPLRSAFTAAYNLPIAPFAGFNETLVMGGLLVGLALWMPVYLATRAFLQLYRNTLRSKILQLPPVRWFTRLPLVQRISGWIRRANAFYQRTW